MNYRQRFRFRIHLVSFLLSLCCAYTTMAQTTAFTYQGKLTDGGNPANGSYDLQFKLFDAATGGTQQGTTQVRNPVTASAGVFSVTLDFGANVFSGAARYLEIGVRPAGCVPPNCAAFTILSPRQPITSSPYAIQTLNAQQLGGVDASQYLKPNASGYVGIGIANALSRLHILSNDPDFPPRLESPGINTFASGWDFYHGATAKGYVGVPGTSASLAPGEMMLFGGNGVKTSLWAGGNRSLTLATNGNVGIGVEIPTSKLEIAAQDGLAISGFQPFLTLRDTNAGFNTRSILAGANGDFGFHPNSFIGGSPAVIIKDGSGNVGIGVSSPTARLQVATGNTSGLHVTSQRNAILGYSSGGGYAAIYGENSAFTGYGVYGKGPDIGVFGIEGRSGGTGVYGEGSTGVEGKSNGNIGIKGRSTGTSSIGVYGEGEQWGGYFYGLNGGGGLYANSVTTDGVNTGIIRNTDWITLAPGGTPYPVVGVVGNFTVTGGKNFIEPHPTDPQKMIEYVTLEGAEAGTFFRGSGHIVNGVATIQVPEDFRMVTDEKGLTIQTTPMGAPATIWCVRKSLDKIELRASADVEFDYLVNGIRRAFKDHTPIVENTAFIPRSADDDSLKNLNTEAVRRLKANGILKEDGSVNMETVEKIEAFKRQKQRPPLPPKINKQPNQPQNQ